MSNSVKQFKLELIAYPAGGAQKVLATKTVACQEYIEAVEAAEILVGETAKKWSTDDWFAPGIYDKNLICERMPYWTVTQV
jgi:hypothetical protein